MVGIISVTGVGAKGSAGIIGNDLEHQGKIIIEFDAMPWQQQPSLQGSVTVQFQGTGPKSAIALSGWASLELHLGQQTFIKWTCLRQPRIGERMEIWYAD